MKAYRRMLGISWKEKKTNEWVKEEINRICGRQLEGFVDMVKRRKFRFFGHMVRGGGVAKAVVEGAMEGRRGRGRPQGDWAGNLKEWSGESIVELNRMALDRRRWRVTVEDWVHQRP